MSKACVLVIEDDPDGLQSVVDVIEDIGVDVVRAANGREGVEAFRRNPVDVVLTDLVMPEVGGLDVLARVKEIDDSVPVLVMTAYGSIESSVKALKSGAYDYIAKPLDLDDLQSKVSRAIEARQLRNQVVELRRSLHDRYSTRTIVAESEPMRRLLGQIETLANTTATVLIDGESGTGKELVARALHFDGNRANGPFVAVNCGAFAETLLESELFGHEKGSFTGAVGRHRGAFERADGGTLFLDEIGDAPKSVQVKLLRALEERDIIRIGGQESFSVDVRVISASNRDLSEMVAAGDFRRDLLYRLKVVALTIPPLRERPEDIRVLTDRFITMACAEHGRQITTVAPAFYRRLEAYDWPGNVRELRNAVEASVVMTTDAALTADSLHLEGDSGGGDAAGDLQIPTSMTLAELERQAIAQQLQRFRGNRTLAAEVLGLSRRTVQRKIKEHGLPF